MLSLNQPVPTISRPPGVVALVVLLLLLAGVSVGFAALLLAGYASLSAGTVLLGGGLEQLGPLAFLLNGALAGILGLGLWKRWRWSRLVTVIYCAGGVLLAIPAVSSAVADGRIFAIVREAIQVIVRVVGIYYLVQEPVKDWFAA